MARSLVDSDEATLYLHSRRAGSDVQGQVNQTLLDRLVAAASDIIWRRTGRVLLPEPALVGDPPTDTAPLVTKTFRIPRSGEVRIPDLRPIGSMVVGPYGYALTTDAYELIQREGIDGLEPATHIQMLGSWPIGGTLTITGRWGFLEVPSVVKTAVCIMAARMYNHKDQKWADRAQAGMEAAAFEFFRELPADIKMGVDLLRVARVAVV